MKNRKVRPGPVGRVVPGHQGGERLRQLFGEGLLLSGAA